MCPWDIFIDCKLREKDEHYQSDKVALLFKEGIHFYCRIFKNFEPIKKL